MLPYERNLTGDSVQLISVACTRLNIPRRMKLLAHHDNTASYTKLKAFLGLHIKLRKRIYT